MASLRLHRAAGALVAIAVGAVVLGLVLLSSAHASRRPCGIYIVPGVGHHMPGFTRARGRIEILDGQISCHHAGQLIDHVVHAHIPAGWRCSYEVGPLTCSKGSTRVEWHFLGS